VNSTLFWDVLLCGLEVSEEHIASIFRVGKWAGGRSAKSILEAQLMLLADLLLAYSSTLKMEAVCFSLKFVNVY
jgi:hypothetical protein